MHRLTIFANQEYLNTQINSIQNELAQFKTSFTGKYFKKETFHPQAELLQTHIAYLLAACETCSFQSSVTLWLSSCQAYLKQLTAIALKQYGNSTPDVSKYFYSDPFMKSIYSDLSQTFQNFQENLTSQMSDEKPSEEIKKIQIDNESISLKALTDFPDRHRFPVYAEPPQVSDVALSFTLECGMRAITEFVTEINKNLLLFSYMDPYKEPQTGHLVLYDVQKKTQAYLGKIAAYACVKACRISDDCFVTETVGVFGENKLKKWDLSVWIKQRPTAAVEMLPYDLVLDKALYHSDNILCDDGKNFLILNSQDQACLKTFSNDGRALHGPAQQLADGKIVFSAGNRGYNNCLKILDLETAQCIKLGEHLTSITSISLLATNILVTGDRHGIVKIWDVERRCCIKTWQAHLYPLSGSQALPTGHIATFSEKDANIKIWNPDTMECLQVLDKKALHSLTLLSNHNFIVHEVASNRMYSFPRK